MSTHENPPEHEPPGRAGSGHGAATESNSRKAAGVASCAAVADRCTAGIGTLTKHVGAGGRVRWTLVVNGVEITMTTRTLMSARRAERKIIETLIAFDIYDMPASMDQREWHRLVVDRLKRLGTPCGRARTCDGSYRIPWWRKSLLVCRRLLRTS